MQTIYPDMSPSVQGNQDGGKWAGAEFSHQEGALGPLEVDMCSGQSKGFQVAMQGFGMGALVCSGRLSLITGEEASQVSAQ